MNPTCETCRWWDPGDREYEFGECHRNPPQIDVMHNIGLELGGPEDVPRTVEGLLTCLYTYFYESALAIGRFPACYYDNFCGEHSPKEQADA